MSKYSSKKVSYITQKRSSHVSEKLSSKGPENHYPNYLSKEGDCYPLSLNLS